MYKLQIAHQIVILLLIGYIVYTVDLKKKFFPVPVVLVIIGIVLSFIPYFSSLHISKEVIFNMFLPGILFTSAYAFPLKQLKQNIGMMAALSTVGLIISFILLGIGIYAVSGFFSASLSWAGAFVVAAILAPTDPVSITAIIKQSGGSEKIADVVEGESLINDGTSIVLFTVFLTMLVTGKDFSAGHFFSDFFLVTVKGLGIGLLLGWLLSWMIYYTSNKSYRVMVTIAAAYGGFYISEFVGGSGVLTTVAVGILLSQEFDKIPEKTELKRDLDGFWDIVKPSLLSVLFLWIGMEGANYLLSAHWGLAAAAFVLSLVVRLIMVGGLIGGVPAWRREFDRPGSAIALISWSGIKGSMSVALLLWLEADASGESEMLVPLAFIAVFLSLLVQSIGIYPLTRLLNKK
ncbi:cation:proton antiporter [Saccharibacillus kuerlensis]|uniref:cation:proton antiporter n=1 Tax=Saccharibacillus kuerlensis TaxID=459527 RepID=UPI00357167BA